MAVDSITVRLVEQADVPALHDREPQPEAHLAQAHLDRQTEGGYFFAVAVDGSGVPLGVGALDARPGRLCPELRGLLVYPEARGHGVATEISRFLESRAAEAGFAEVFLRVDPENETAIPVFIGLDYSPTGDHLPALPDGSAEPDAGRLDAVFRKSLRIV
ncbi:MAG: GNAT family N-acetyltransferase [Propionibacteriaceae bacterium]|jgi:GNAT superfamily N-acetyltransferase|nr:GNAT family N-acetyltransferase [Propionibacteriaceae bacterium]